MFDATRLLGALSESMRAPSAPQRMNAALEGGAAAPANPMQQILAQLGQAGGSGGQQLGGLFGNMGDLAQRAFGGTAREVRSNNPVAVGGLGAMAGALLGGGRGAVGGGLLAALGSLAFAALQNAGQPAAAAAPDSHAALHDGALLALRAMIEAAKADGRVDAKEQALILGRLESAGADADARDWVRGQLAAPQDLAGLAAMAATPEQAAQAYAAALMAIEVDTPEERAFLHALAQALRLPPEAAQHLERSLGVAA